MICSPPIQKQTLHRARLPPLPRCRRRHRRQRRQSAWLLRPSPPPPLTGSASATAGCRRHTGRCSYQVAPAPVACCAAAPDNNAEILAVVNKWAKGLGVTQSGRLPRRVLPFKPEDGTRVRPGGPPAANAHHTAQHQRSAAAPPSRQFCQRGAGDVPSNLFVRRLADPLAQNAAVEGSSLVITRARGLTIRCRCVSHLPSGRPRGGCASLTSLVAVAPDPPPGHWRFEVALDVAVDAAYHLVGALLLVPPGSWAAPDWAIAMPKRCC